MLTSRSGGPGDAGGSTRFPAPSLRVVTIFTAAVCVVMALAVACLYGLSPEPKAVHEENGVLEMAQLGLWLAAAGVGAFLLIRARRGVDRLNTLWLTVIAGLAASRELDLHERLNPEALGAWGVHFRVDWWLDPSQPLAVKAVWVVAAACLATLLIGPPLLMRVPALKLLRRGDTVTIMFGVSIALLAGGYAADDIFGRGLLLPVQIMQAGEEIVELAGVAAFLGCLVLTRFSPLSTRVGFVRGREGDGSRESSSEAAAATPRVTPGSTVRDGRLATGSGIGQSGTQPMPVAGVPRVSEQRARR